jgi:hypothetical protein
MGNSATATTGDISISWDGMSQKAAVATPFSGVAQAATITGPTATGSSASALTVASNTSDMVLDAVSEYGTGAGDPGSGQTLQARFNDGFSTFGGVSTASGATSVTMSWSLNGHGQYYTHAAIDIPAVPSPTTTALIAPSSITYGTNASITVTVSCGAGTPTGNVSLTVDGGTPLTQALSGGSTVFSVPSLNAGNHNLSASYAAQATFDTSSATGTLTVNPAPLTITAKGESKTYGTTFTPDGTNQCTSSGLVNGDVVTSVTLTSNGYAATATVVGSPYAITPSTAVGHGLGNYSISYVNGTLLVNPAPLTVTATNQTKIQGEANPTFMVSYSGFVLGEGPSVLGGMLTCSTTATKSSPPGTYAITPAGLTSSNYAITFVNGTLTVISYSQATTNLRAQVDGAGLPHGMQSSLDSKLQAALASFTQGDTTDAKNQLGAFINQVSAQRGQQIAAGLADALIANAQEIINAVG